MVPEPRRVVLLLGLPDSPETETRVLMDLGAAAMIGRLLGKKDVRD